MASLFYFGGGEIFSYPDGFVDKILKSLVAVLVLGLFYDLFGVGFDYQVQYVYAGGYMVFSDLNFQLFYDHQMFSEVN